MIATLLPTPADASNAAFWIACVLSASAVLGAFVLFVTILLNHVEDWRIARLNAQPLERQARIREIEDEKHYQRSLRTAKEVGPWPPPRRVQ